jgi:preprotein translocase subunit SecA
MSGTLQPVARELWRVYRRKAVTIPTAKPVRRIHRPDVVVTTEAAKWTLIVYRVAEFHARGVPVLIGTRSVIASERASEGLHKAGLCGAAQRAKSFANRTPKQCQRFT